VRVSESAVSAAELMLRQRKLAGEVLPPEVLDYFESGSDDEVARDEAEQAWRRFRLVPSVLRDVAEVDLSTALFGTRLPSPIMVAPTASHGLAAADAELATARGAAEAGSVYTVSTRASASIEDIAEAADRWWMQIYLLRDRAVTAGIAERAKQAGAEALVLTGDTPFVGRKPRQGRPRPLEAPQNLVNLGRHLSPGSLAAQALEQDPHATERDIGWLADITGLPVLVKGVLRADDARRCLDAGAAGLIVSNHGGRQLSRAIPTAEALADVVDASGSAPVLVDGGIRSGQDVLVALALGAAGVMLGRPVLWALAAGGAAAVSQLLCALHSDTSFALRLLGVRSLAELDRGFVRR
jgi:4-hydroxymandelate oxidase